MVLKMMENIGVEFTENEVAVQYRTGRKKEGDTRPRPLIMRIEKEETRAMVLKDSRKLARVEAWKRVFVSPDLTFQQREEERKKDDEMREEARKKTQEDITAGKSGKWILVGPRGKRWTKWIEE